MIEDYEKKSKKAEAREAKALSRIEQIKNILLNNQKDPRFNSDEEILKAEAMIEVPINENIKNEITEEKNLKYNKIQEHSDAATFINESVIISASSLGIVKTENVKIVPKVSNELKPAIINKQKVNDQTIEPQYRPSIRMNQKINALSQSPSNQERKLNIKLNRDFHPSKESANIFSFDSASIIKTLSLHGYSTDSKLQDMIYNKEMALNKLIIEDQIKIEQKNRDEIFLKFTSQDTRVNSIDFDDVIKPYKTSFKFNEPIHSKLITKELKEIIEKNIDYYEVNDFHLIESDLINAGNLRSHFEEEEFYIEPEHGNKISLFTYNYMNIEEILTKILYKPINIQTRMVNKCLLNYFLFELKLEEHFASIRKFMFFENAEFSQCFVDDLSEKMLLGNGELRCLNRFNSILVNEALCKAVAKSGIESHIADYLTIRVNREKENGFNKHEEINYPKQVLVFLNCLELGYQRSWPLNIVITEKCMNSYNQVFQFLLQIKIVLSALNSVWYKLKQYGKYFFT